VFIDVKSVFDIVFADILISQLAKLDILRNLPNFIASLLLGWRAHFGIKYDFGNPVVLMSFHSHCRPQAIGNSSHNINALQYAADIVICATKLIQATTNTVVANSETFGPRNLRTEK
jgi:hypothetical protein